MRLSRGLTVLTLFALLLGVPPASAEVAQADPPARVGRLAHVEGTVSTHRAGEDQWSAAERNLPVTSGDSFWTEPGSRAEIQIGPTALRMDETSELDVTRLDDRATEFELRQGSINLTLRAVSRDGVRILTPRGEVVLTLKGSYRIDAGQAGDSAPPVQVTVLDGFARVHGARGTIELHRGESATIDGDPAAYSVDEAASAPIDEWAEARERNTVARNSRRYVPQDMTGYEDLDSHGRWRSDPAYGPVWYPAAVPVGWAPYRYGHWAYVGPWGWTWIDDAPWGFAPFHYGRWALIGRVWGWCPGTFVARPVYAPALVAFVGGSNWGISLSIGAAIGWLPLAPFEVYRPYYPASVTYVRNVNITNVHTTVINTITHGGTRDRGDIGHYKNREHATVVAERDFSGGKHVREASVQVQRERLAHAPVAQRLDHVRPEAGGREQTRGPAIRNAEGRGTRGDASVRAGRRGPSDSVGGKGAENARIAPSAGRPEAAGREDRRQATGANAPTRDSRDGAAPGPRIQPRDARAPNAGQTPNPGASAQTGEPRGKRSGGVEVLPEPRGSNAAPGPEIKRRAPGADGRVNAPETRSAPRSAREEPVTRPAQSAPSPVMRAPRESAPRDSMPRESTGPQRERPPAHAQPPNAQPPKAQSVGRQPGERRAPRPDPQVARPVPPQVQGMPRVASPSMPSPPVVRGQAPQTGHAPGAQPQMPESGGPQDKPERRRHGNAP
jgi:hypothetical protein